MRKSLTAPILAASLALAALTAPTPADARGGWVAGGIIGGLAAGAIIGGALASPYYYGPGPYYGPGYAPAPAYYYGAPAYYGPRCYWQRQRVWTGYGWAWTRGRVCY